MLLLSSSVVRSSMGRMLEIDIHEVKWFISHIHELYSFMLERIHLAIVKRLKNKAL
jgi:hypothetical protein